MLGQRNQINLDCRIQSTRRPYQCVDRYVFEPPRLKFRDHRLANASSFGELALADSQPLPSLRDLLLKHQAVHFLLDHLTQTPFVNLVFEPGPKWFLGFCRSHKHEI
jgi:hypothetical protein